MKNLSSVILLIAVIFVFPACYTLNTVNSPTDVPIQISNAKEQNIIGHFESSMWVNHFIAGLVTPNDPDVSKIVAEQVKMKGGTGAVNVKVNYQMTFVNGLLNGITAGIYNPFTLKIEGDVVK